LKKEFNFKKITTPTLLYLLKDEIPFPNIFLFKCKLSLGKFQSTIDQKFPADLVKFITLP
jgi:hypothetical protein